MAKKIFGYGQFWWVGSNIANQQFFKVGLMFALNPCPAEPGYTLTANSVDPDQLASEEANWSGSALFAIKYVNL